MPDHVLEAHVLQLNREIMNAITSFTDRVKDLNPKWIVGDLSGMRLTALSPIIRELSVRILLQLPDNPK